MSESDYMEDEVTYDPNYDPDSDAWFARLLFWRPSKLSDEEMQLHFYEWDGRWSFQTKLALQRFKAQGLGCILINGGQIGRKVIQAR